MKIPKSIAILLVDDHAVVREELALILDRQSDMRVVAQADNGQEAIDLYRTHRPDVTLMDVRMPVMDGIEATRRICQEFPSANILIFTTYLEDEVIAATRHAGAKGHLFKGATREELLSSIQEMIA